MYASSPRGIPYATPIVVPSVFTARLAQQVDQMAGWGEDTRKFRTRGVYASVANRYRATYSRALNRHWARGNALGDYQPYSLATFGIPLPELQPEILCCDKWLPYPTAEWDSWCPTCKSTFTLCGMGGIDVIE